MKTAMVLTAIGDDRPGLVEMLAKVVADHGGNWEASRMARLGGKFAGIVEITFDGAAPADLDADLAALAERGLSVAAEAAPESPERATASLELELVGNDRPGILSQISRVLAAHEVNVEELGTVCEEAPMAGGALFRLRALLVAPPSLDRGRLEGELEALSHDLMVEIELSDDDA